jgi:hypothetical protein
MSIRMQNDQSHVQNGLRPHLLSFLYFRACLSVPHDTTRFVESYLPKMDVVGNRQDRDCCKVVNICSVRLTNRAGSRTYARSQTRSQVSNWMVNSLRYGAKFN